MKSLGNRRRSASDPYRRALSEVRQHRLHRLMELHAPGWMVEQECCLVIEAVHGSLFRAWVHQVSVWLREHIFFRLG